MTHTDTAQTASAGSMGRAVFLGAMGNAAPAVATLASAPILAQGLGVEGRGTVAAATAPYLLAAAVAVFGLAEALTWGVARAGRDGAWSTAKRIALLALPLGLLALMACLAAGPMLADGNQDLADALVVGACAVPFAIATAILRGLAAGLHLWGLVAVERTIGGGVRLFGLLGLLLVDNFSIVAVTACLTFGPGLSGAVYLPLLRRIRRFGVEPESGHGATPRSTDLASFAGRVWLGSVAGILLLRIDQVMMVELSTATQLGLYAVAVNLSEVPLIVNAAFRDAVFSRDAGARDNVAVARAARQSLILATLIALVVVGSSFVWVEYVFGPGFAGSSLPAAILALGIIGGIPGSVTGSALSVRGNPGLRSGGMAVASVVNIGLLVMLLPEHGAMGAAWATLAASVMAGGSNLFFMRRRHGLKITDAVIPRVADLADLAKLAAGFAAKLVGRTSR